MAIAPNQYKFTKFNLDLDHPERCHLYAFTDNTTGKSYILPTKPQDYSVNDLSQADAQSPNAKSLIDSLCLSYGKLHARKYFLIHTTIGLPISIIVTAYKIVARIIKIISCLLPIPVGLSLKERAKTIKAGFKFIAWQSYTLVAREAMNVYGIFKPLEANVWFANHQLCPINGGPILIPFDIRGFPIQPVQAMTDVEIENRLNNLFHGVAKIKCGIDGNGVQRQELTLEANTRNTCITNDKLIELGQNLRNIPNLHSLSLVRFGFTNIWGNTVACLFPLAAAHRQPHLEEIIIKEPLATFYALPRKESVQALFDSNPQFKRLQISISQASIDANSRRYVQQANLLAPPTPDFSQEARQRDIETVYKMRDEAFDKVRQMKLNGVEVFLASYIMYDVQNGGVETTQHTVTFERK